MVRRIVITVTIRKGIQMERNIIITVKELDKIQKRQMKISFEAAQKYPGQYQELRFILEKILLSGLDISEYYETVTKLASLLKPLFEVKVGSIFYYPYKNRSPEIYGQAENLVEEVKKLLHQMDKLDAFLRESERKGTAL